MKKLFHNKDHIAYLTLKKVRNIIIRNQSNVKFQYQPDCMYGISCTSLSLVLQTKSGRRSSLSYKYGVKGMVLKVQI